MSSPQVSADAKRVAVVQSNYIPWRGYFHMISAVDEFILFDDVQYTKRDWRNRNQIKTPQGLIWLTVPVQVKGKYFQPIREVEIDDLSWADKHWRTIELNYARAPFYSEVADFLSPIYEASRQDTNLSSVNRRFIQAICDYTGIETKISDSSDYEIIDGKNERLISLCEQANAVEYVSGPSAAGYMDESLFETAGMTVTWFDYSRYEKYPQLWGEYAPAVSIIDVLFNCGPAESHRIISSPSGGNSSGI